MPRVRLDFSIIKFLPQQSRLDLESKLPYNDFVTARFKRRALWFLGVTGVVVTAFWLATHPRHHDPFPFLQNQSLLDVKVVGPGSFGPKEVRLYSWRQPQSEVIALAKAELPKFGLKQLASKNQKSDSVDWTAEVVDGGLCGLSSDTWVTILPGHSTSLTSERDPKDYIPEWTTVVVSSSLDESWLNVVRYTLFGWRD